MTISSETRKAGPFPGNDVTTVFPFAFKVFSSADLQVVRADLVGAETTLVMDADYTVSLNPSQNTDPGGEITLSAALASGYSMVITTSLQFLQPADLTNNGGFFPQIITNALDRLTILSQQLAESISRSLKFSISTPSGVNPELPTPVPYSLISWNATGDGFQNTDPTYSSALATDLASNASGKGGALVGDDDGASGSLWTTIRGFITYLRSSLGASIVGIGTQTVYDILKNQRLDLAAVSAPIVAPTVAVNPDAGNLNGTTRYYITFVTALGETAVGTVASSDVSPANQQVDLSNISVSSDASVIARSIYRTPAGAADAVLAQFVATINDNTTTTYTDNIPDASLGAHCPRMGTAGGEFYKNGVRIGQLGLTSALGLNCHPNNSGYANTAFGANCMWENVSGYRNTGTGVFALTSNVSGARNSAFGVHALNDNVSGNDNTGIGYAAGFASLGLGNTAVGSYALTTTTANYGTAVGTAAAQFVTTGAQNSAVGFESMQLTTTGSQNAVFGARALKANVGGNFNTVVGAAAGSLLTSSSNVAIGFSALSSCTAGQGNIAVGAAAGKYETGSNKLFIDNQPRANEADARIKALLYGVFGVNPADQTLTVNGSFVSALGFGCNGKTAQAAVTVNAASTDLATAIALVNQLRAALIANGICV